MIIEYDDTVDTLWIVLCEDPGLRAVVESETPGVLLRVNRATGKICSLEVMAYKRRVARGPIMIPEIGDPTLLSQLFTA